MKDQFQDAYGGSDRLNRDNFDKDIYGSDPYDRDLHDRDSYDRDIFDDAHKTGPYSAGFGADPDEIIRANGLAEAMEMDDLKQELRASAAQIKRLEDLYERNNALIDQLRQVNDETMRRIGEMNEETTRRIGEITDRATETIAANSAVVKDIDWDGMHRKFSDLLQQSDEFSHKENVRVYRNIQAATDQLLQKQTQELVEQTQKEQQKTKELLEESRQDIKKAQEEMLQQNKKALSDELAPLKAPKKKVPVLQILILILVAANLAVHILDKLGLLALPSIFPG